ncbi:MAG: hypothetical protein HC802_02550 [Caldilineaceae bacterium]|nr:hypothetical protein [Caldilineaceae bacterium]
MTLREVLKIWMTKPGGMKVRFYLPAWLAGPMFGMLEPFVRWMGLPAFVSREVVAATVSLNFSSAKAQAELGWSYQPANEMWLDIMDEERALLGERRQRDLVSRLKPVLQSRMPA